MSEGVSNKALFLPWIQFSRRVLNSLQRRILWRYTFTIHLYQHNSNSVYVTRIHLHDKFPTRTRNDNTILVLKGENKLISRFWWHINARIKICDVRPSRPSSVLDRDYLFLGRLLLGSVARHNGIVMNWHNTSNLRYDVNRWIMHSKTRRGLFLDELAPTSTHHFSLIRL